MTTLSPVPDPEPLPPAAQLPLFEAHRPSRFEITLTGTIELDLTNADEAALARDLTLTAPFYVTVTSGTGEVDRALTFFSSVTKRTHKRVKGDAIVSVATLTVAPEE